jgi:hypothetical protein
VSLRALDDARRRSPWRLVLFCALSVAATQLAAQTAGSAVVADTAVGPERPGPYPRFFYIVEAIEGKRVANSLSLSRQRSFGQGAMLHTLPYEREVPAGKVRLTLGATQAHGMPAEEIIRLMLDSLPSVSGDVEVTLEPGVRYRVQGVLDGAFRREVWLEEVGSGRIVAKIVKPLSAEEQATLASADRYACCNLHYAERWISDGNWAEQPFLLPGARVKITGWGRNRAFVSIDGRPIEAGVDYSRKEQSREQFADQIFVREDPRPRIASWSPEVQEAIAAGKIRKGMTKEQVVVSLGVPRPDRTPDSKARKWIYFASETAEFDIDFDDAERVEDIQAATRVRKIVWMSP